jgi:ribosomal protein S18 acetylase RimI-like enzyme
MVSNIDQASEKTRQNEHTRIKYMTYPIRQLNIDDYQELLQLWRRCELSHRPKGRDSYEKMAKEFKRHETCILGMFDGDKMIGSIIGSSDGRKGWINRLAIDPDYRGQELAGILIEECEDFLHKLGLKLIAALIEANNDPSFKAFKKAGYIFANGVTYCSKRTSAED